MTAQTAITTGKCGAKARSTGEPCTRPAGWGTSHPGSGRCKHHTGSTPVGIKAAAREEAKALITGWHLAIDVDPLDGLLQTIRSSAGQVAHANALIERNKGRVTDQELERLRALQHDLARFCKMALDAGVADRKVRVAERTGALIAAAAERAMAAFPEVFSAEMRGQFARSFERELAVLERTTDED